MSPRPSTAAPADAMVRAVAPSDEARVDAAIERLASTDSAGELAVMLRERRHQIELVEPGDPRLPAGAGGRWDGPSQRMYLDRSQVGELGFETLLAHEAEHMRDAGGLPQTVGNALLGIGRALGSLAVAPLRLDNPVTAAVDSLRASYQVAPEVGAYHVQARVAHELGLHADFLQHEDHTPRSSAELERWLLDEPLYALPLPARTAIGAGFAGIAGRATGQLANAAIGRLAPNSWLAGHGSVVTGAAFALWAGLLVQDHLAHRPRD
jgi:hypothetical protein